MPFVYNSLRKYLPASAVARRGLLTLKTKKGYDRLMSSSVLFSRGCPYQCVFCAMSIDGYMPGIRYRNPKHVQEEIEYLKREYGVEGISIFDDLFDRIEGLIDFGLGFFEVNNVDAVPLHENIFFHFGIPTAGKMTKVGSCGKQDFQIYLWHKNSLIGLSAIDVIFVRTCKLQDPRIKSVNVCFLFLI